MSQPVTCPHCAAALRVPPGVTVALLTCPRCQGSIPNPQAGEGSTASSQAVVCTIDTAVDPAAQAHGKSFFRIAGFFALGLGVMGVATGILTNLLRSIEGSEQAAYVGTGLTLAVFSMLAAPMLLARICRVEQVGKADSEGFGQVVAIALLWLGALLVAVFAAFLVFITACVSGFFAGELLR